MMTGTEYRQLSVERLEEVCLSEIYDQSWHDYYGHQTLKSAAIILPFVRNILPFSSIIEIGCGHGHWLAAARALGAIDVLGVDGPWTDRAKLLIPEENFIAADLGQPFTLDRSFDLALSTEVAEHIAPESADIFVDTLCALSRVVLFGAAIPLQGGFAHVNEQWPSYWIAKFMARGFQPIDVIRPKFWTDREIHYFYRQNILVFVHEEETEILAAFRDAEAELVQSTLPLDLVLPERFSVMASYDSIVLKRLLPKLPGTFMRAVRRKTARWT